VLIGPTGLVIDRVGVGGGEIRRVVEKATGAAGAPDDVAEVPPIGDPAPVFTLPGLDGEDIDLVALRGRLTLLVHWSPTCVYCRELYPRLRNWQASITADQGPRLVVVSSGSAAANIGEGFRPMALDNGRLTRRAFGFDGTPEALLIDANGNVASPKVVGPDAVIALAERATELAAAARRLESRRIPVRATTAGTHEYHSNNGGEIPEE
jgi:hypothetical protein